jgi:hypothetical protein
MQMKIIYLLLKLRFGKQDTGRAEPVCRISVLFGYNIVHVIRVLQLSRCLKRVCYLYSRTERLSIHVVKDYSAEENILTLHKGSTRK